MPSLGGGGKYGGDDVSGGYGGTTGGRSDSGGNGSPSAAGGGFSYDQAMVSPKITPEDIERYKDYLKNPEDYETQEENINTTGETGYVGPKAPFDLKTPLGLAKFFSGFTSIDTGLVNLGKSLKYNYQRTKALESQVASDYGVSPAEAKNMIKSSGLRITDVFSSAPSVGDPAGDEGDGSGSGSTKMEGSGGLVSYMSAGTAGGNYADPNSLFGGTGGSYPSTPEGSAAASIEQQELQRKIVEALYDPYYRSATEGALPQLMAMTTGEGDVDYKPSKLYEYSKEKGERNIRRSQAAKGLLGSSATADITAEFGAELAGEEAQRLYQGQLSRLQIGSGAADAVTSASQSLGGNVGAIYSSLGGQKASEQLALGESRQSAYQGLANTLSGLAKYMASR